jgi:hypothetical protein
MDSRHCESYILDSPKVLSSLTLVATIMGCMVHVYLMYITIILRFEKESFETLIIGVWMPKPI